MNAYLTIAESVLRAARQPLTARQLLRSAYHRRLVPEGLYGRTQFKTMQARLAEDILWHRDKSFFVRTDPGRFFLRSFLADPTIPARYRSEYIAPIRADQLENYHVLCIERAQIDTTYSVLLAPDGPLISSLSTKSELLSFAKQNKDLVAIKTIVVPHKSKCLLLKRKYRYTAEGFNATASLGISTYVKSKDRTLFSTEEFGFVDAAIRALGEQLHFPPHATNGLFDENAGRQTSFVHNREDRGSLAAIAVVQCPSSLDPVKRFGEGSNFSWLPSGGRPNDGSTFDVWSSYILGNTEILTWIRRVMDEQDATSRSAE